MKDLYDRFGLKTDLELEIKKFQTKVNNIFWSSKFGSEMLDDKEDNISWRFANHVGEHYDHPVHVSEKAQLIIPSNLSFNEFLFRLQVTLNLLWESRPEISTHLGYILENFFHESALGLGFFVKIYKTKSPQILPARNRQQQQKIITAIDQLEAKPEKYRATIEHFEQGMKELLSAKTKAQLKDVVEDMSTVCDSLAKVIFKDKNLGFKHFFKDKRWEKVRLNEAQRRIFSDLNKTIDQIKHDVIKTYTKEDVETIVYLTSTFIEKVAR